MGRPRKFDREEALDEATRAFWKHGYEATSTNDLLDAMGIGRQSLYNSFGDKKTIFLEVLRRYRRGSDHYRADLRAGGRDAIKAHLYSTAEELASPGQ